MLNRHEYFLSFNDGNAQTNLRKDDLLACNIIIPPLELQEQFAKIHDVWATIKENAQSLNSFNYAITKSHKSQNYIYYIGYLNDTPCVCGICIITKFGLYGVFRYSLIKTDPIYRCVNIHTSKLLSRYAYNNMSILNIYNLGARKNENGVINFKENTSAGKVISYKLNIDELLKV